MNKIKAIFRKDKKKETGEEVSDEKGKSPPDRKRQLIIGVIILALVGLIAEDLIFDDTPSETATEDEMAKKIAENRKKRAPPPKPTDATEGPEVEVPPTERTDTPPIDVSTKTDPVVTPEVIVDVPASDPPVLDSPVIDVQEPPVVDVPEDSTPVVDISDSDGDSDVSDDIVGGPVSDVPEEDMTDKILEDLEKQVKQTKPKREVTTYVAPPDFEYRGRGLVYNCVGKHWACVDGASYKTCEDNFSSTRYLKKKVECYPFNVYEAPRGCESMQNRVVSSNAKTDFCKGH